MIEEITQENQFPAKTRIRYVLIIILLTVFNIFAFTFFVHGKDFEKDIMGNFTNALTTFVFALPILSLIIGLIVALFTYKQLEYKKKYFRSFLLTLGSINVLFAIGLFLTIVMKLLGYPLSSI
ncbi:MAG: hypothetical protein FWC39_02530 [Bacteroidetes bacterium]|nr:hypothetical protein [Bacteroidota bacterium]